MVFSSIDFLCVFLPAFLIAQSTLPFKNLLIVAFSVLFYFVGEGVFTTVVLGSVGMNFLFGLAIDSNDGHRRKAWLVAAVAANLSLLIFFKYAKFIGENIFGRDVGQELSAIHLPLGISFFTFHAMSYLIDVYRHAARAERSLVNLAVYILMFPQLIAGPILRYAKIAPQLVTRSVTTLHVYYGFVFFAFGLGEKVLIADTMAGIADPLFRQWTALSFETAWLAVIAYTFQIFFDFSGYSTMAIGLGLICGFDFPQNFNFPYISQSITEFWRRWHMTLSSWFRDYLYIPLGGNRDGALKTYRNLFLVFLLCGLWHGAAWTFVLWGLYHGSLLVIERIGLGALLQRAPAAARHLYALLAIMIGWVLFRAESIEQATGLLARMFTPDDGTSDIPIALYLTGETVLTLAAATLLSTPLVLNALRPWMAVPIQRPWPAQLPARAYSFGFVAALLVLAASFVKIITGSYSPFIYFRF
jgi:alginate O-acetyltransferase complex protein AlgI